MKIYHSLFCFFVTVCLASCTVTRTPDGTYSLDIHPQPPMAQPITPAK